MWISRSLNMQSEAFVFGALLLFISYSMGAHIVGRQWGAVVQLRIWEQQWGKQIIVHDVKGVSSREIEK